MLDKKNTLKKDLPLIKLLNMFMLFHICMEMHLVFQKPWCKLKCMECCWDATSASQTERPVSGPQQRELLTFWNYLSREGKKLLRGSDFFVVADFYIYIHIFFSPGIILVFYFL